MRVSPALAEGRYYHVTSRAALQRIAAEGLRPNSVSGAAANFGEYHVEDDCVYLWPSIGNAQAYLQEHADRFDTSQRAIIEVEGVDLSQVCPDQEELARHWEDNEPDMEELLAAAHAQSPEDLPPPGQELDYASSAELIRALDPELRLALANVCAVRGDALMARQSILPSRLASAELNDWETLDEQFAEEHPHLDPWASGELDEDVEAQREEAYEHWMSSRAAGGAIIDREMLAEELQDPSELVDNAQRRYYRLTPLSGESALAA